LILVWQPLFLDVKVARRLDLLAGIRDSGKVTAEEVVDMLGQEAKRHSLSSVTRVVFAYNPLPEAGFSQGTRPQANPERFSCMSFMLSVMRTSFILFRPAWPRP